VIALDPGTITMIQGVGILDLEIRFISIVMPLASVLVVSLCKKAEW
jgi:hypothetical protein